MIKFFRKIRQNLLLEEKTGTYLKYAIGEIVLVMIGILLALQVSNWNQDRKDRKSERKSLANIHKDFIQNKIGFDSVKAINYRSLAALDSMIALFPLKRVSLKNASFWKYYPLIQYHTYNPYSSSVDLVVNSNSIQLIQDEALQELLVSWKDVLLDYQEEEDFYYKMMNDHFWPYWREVLDYSGLDNEISIAGSSTIKFQNYMMDKRNYLRAVVKAIEEEPIENHINEIIRLTESIEY
ncbi:MAG: hypothetical protein CMC55_00500 [Flavobacteriaceae bacterium]|uniref:DUF6090 family protein n=1 Tax=Bizionia echini TaxID=649333 RepID=UPI000C94E716|nr:hypothetical protein [Flavobacteriaceae bacterium]